MRILFAAAEAAPYAKVGGLGDVAGALPKALRRLGHDVRVVMPRYRRLGAGTNDLRPAPDGASYPVAGSPDSARLHETTHDEVPVYFVEHDGYFGRNQIYGYPDDTERFLYFSRAALLALGRLGWSPDVIHCHDWHTAIIPHWIRTDPALPVRARAASVLTIHNLAYQGWFDPADLNPAWINPATGLAPSTGSPIK